MEVGGASQLRLRYSRAPLETLGMELRAQAQEDGMGLQQQQGTLVVATRRCASIQARLRSADGRALRRTLHYARQGPLRNHYLPSYDDLPTRPPTALAQPPRTAHTAP